MLVRRHAIMQGLVKLIGAPFADAVLFVRRDVGAVEFAERRSQFDSAGECCAGGSSVAGGAIGGFGQVATKGQLIGAARLDCALAGSLGGGTAAAIASRQQRGRQQRRARNAQCIAEISDLSHHLASFTSPGVVSATSLTASK